MCYFCFINSDVEGLDPHLKTSLSTVQYQLSTAYRCQLVRADVREE